MSRPTKNSAHMNNTSVSKENSMISQDSSSSDQEMEAQSPPVLSATSTSQPPSFVQPMFMPYIEGPKMDWTVNDSLYHRFLKWKLKCENTSMLVNLPCYLNLKMQESHSMEWRFWYGSICVMVLAHRRSKLGSYLGQV